jgi:hypothetical protein
MIKTIAFARDFFSAVNHSASLDNRFGHKMLAVCYGFIIFFAGYGFYQTYYGGY